MTLTSTHSLPLWAVALALGGFFCSDSTPAEARPVPGSAQEVWRADRDEGTLPDIPSEVESVPPSVPAPKSDVKIGVEDFLGISNLPGRRTYSDGIWVGSSFTTPSVASVTWENGKGAAARLALGLGDLYTGSGAVVQQPVEAWGQMPVGGASLTVGKYYVPFALQEWEWETKPGAMLQWARGANTLAVSENYNHNTRSGNAYLRLGRTVSRSASLGLSLAAGKGVSFDTSHNRGWGLDGTFTHGPWQLAGEYDEFRNGASQLFHFAYGKLSLTNLGPWKPFVGLYEWNDAAQELGHYRSSVFGLGYQISPNFTVEGGYAPTAKDTGRPATWLQLHSTWQNGL